MRIRFSFALVVTGSILSLWLSACSLGLGKAEFLEHKSTSGS